MRRLVGFFSLPNLKGGGWALRASIFGYQMLKVKHQSHHSPRLLSFSPSFEPQKLPAHPAVLWAGKRGGKGRGVGRHTGDQGTDGLHGVLLLSCFRNTKRVCCLLLSGTYKDLILPLLISNRHCERALMLKLPFSKGVHAMWGLTWRKKTRGDSSCFERRRSAALCEAGSIT